MSTFNTLFRTLNALNERNRTCSLSVRERGRERERDRDRYGVVRRHFVARFAVLAKGQSSVVRQGQGQCRLWLVNQWLCCSYGMWPPPTFVSSSSQPDSHVNVVGYVGLYVVHWLFFWSSYCSYIGAILIL